MQIEFDTRAASAEIQGAESVRIDWQPGNATRYDVLFTDLQRGGFWAMAVLNEPFNACIPLLPGWIHPSYLSKKLDVSDGDAEAISKLCEAFGAWLERRKEVL